MASSMSCYRDPIEEGHQEAEAETSAGKEWCDIATSPKSPFMKFCPPEGSDSHRVCQIAFQHGCELGTSFGALKLDNKRTIIDKDRAAFGAAQETP